MSELLSVTSASYSRSKWTFSSHYIDPNTHMVVMNRMHTRSLYSFRRWSIAGHKMVQHIGCVCVLFNKAIVVCCILLKDSRLSVGQQKWGFWMHFRKTKEFKLNRRLKYRCQALLCSGIRYKNIWMRHWNMLNISYQNTVIPKLFHHILY